MSVAVLSAHLGNAVFSATAQLLPPNAQMPPALASPLTASGRSCWDGITCARSSAEVHREQLAEDDRAAEGLGCTVFLCANLPHPTEHGWPSWVTGEPTPLLADPGFWVEQELVRAGPSRQAPKANPFEVRPLVRRHKDGALLCCRTQLAALHLAPVNRCRWEGLPAL